MNTFTRISIALAAISMFSGQLPAQDWPGGSIGGSCMGSPLCGCADCRAQLGRCAPGMGMPGFGAVAGRMAGPVSQLRSAAATHLHPMSTVAEGYHPGALAHPPIFGQQVANPYGGFPGVGCGGGYINEGDLCCGPSWYDVSIQGVFLRRSGDASTAISGFDPAFTTAVAQNMPPNTNAVLSTDSANFDLEGSYRVAARYQLNAVSAIEAIYLGELESDGFASFTAANDGLFHVFSQFGANPLGGYEDTDQAREHTIAVEGQLESVELQLRRSWITPGCRASGSWLFGARYYRVEDNLLHTTRVVSHPDPFAPDFNLDPLNPITRPDGNMAYQIDTTNDLVGVQFGAEVSYCVIPGLSVGGHTKMGLFGNHAGQNSQITASTLAAPIIESASSTRFSYGSDAAVYVLWQFHPLIKFRGGYEVLFLNDVATGAANFDTGTPFPPNPTRNVGINHDEILYRGFHLGLELGW